MLDIIRICAYTYIIEREYMKGQSKMNKQQIISEASKYTTEKHPIMDKVEAAADMWIELIDAHRAADEAADQVAYQLDHQATSRTAYIRDMWAAAEDGKVYEFIISKLCEQVIMHSDKIAKLAVERQREMWAQRIDSYINERYEHYQVMVASRKADGSRDMEAERWSLS